MEFIEFDWFEQTGFQRETIEEVEATGFKNLD
jgi:hypothetical protein